MRRIILAALTLVPVLGACTPTRVAPRSTASVTVEPAAPVEPWRTEASADDAARIDAIDGVWARAAERLPTRDRRAAAAEGALLKPGAALDHPELSPGSYSCRVLRLGAGRLRSFPANFCYVQSAEGGTLTIAKQTGSDLPAGALYPAGDTRYVFLGARQRKEGETGLAYGTDRERDIAGVVERVAPFRWRIVLPARDGRSVDVYEMTPVPIERQPG